jgi:catechol-2,3-dioxygenase
MERNRVHAAVVAVLLAFTAPAAAEPIEMRGIGWVILRSKQPETLARFYAALGFEEWARSPRVIGFKAGGGAALEITRLDPAAPDPVIPASSRVARHITTLGSRQAKEIAVRAKAAGAPWVDEYKSGDVSLFYICDPEGNVIGFGEDGPMWGNQDELTRVPDVKVAPGSK